MYRREILSWDGDTRVRRCADAGSKGSDDQAARSRSYTVSGSRGPKPPCFDDEEQWLAWQKLDEITKNGPSLYCADCTPRYAQQMRIEGRCAHPNIKFYRVNGALIGASKPPSEIHIEVVHDEETKPHPAISTEADS